MKKAFCFVTLPDFIEVRFTWMEEGEEYGQWEESLPK
jgi:hypothetical protein